jgi:hypothetical protein
MITVAPIGDPALSKDKKAIPRSYYGLSGDEKPADVANGSTFLEIDTGNVFCFDAENKIWHKW